MPLRKLWNALRGHHPSAGQLPKDSGTRETGHRVSRERDATASTKQTMAAPDVAKPTHAKPSAKKSRRILGLSRSPHTSLCRLVKQSNAKSVLEIGVSDGTRAIAVVQTLSKADPKHPIRYAAIDQFELAGGEVSLLQFHRELRKNDIRPQIFPSDIESGLTRVAYTLGAVDLILMSESAAADKSVSENDWHRLLQRVTHQESVVLRQSGDQWNEIKTHCPSRAIGRRAA